MKKIYLLSLLGGLALVAGCNLSPTANPAAPVASAIDSTNREPEMNTKVSKTDAEWQKELTPEQFAVLRQKGTERAFTGAYWNTKDPGTYRCAGCGEVLFQSDTKYDSGCGWPSFYAPNSSNVVAEAVDNTHLMQRTEVLCSKCGGHLGHVFDDGPKPTGLRYCINSASLKFEPKPAEEKK
jgi:peptide-methionine (R)-S-oxide reductase